MIDPKVVLIVGAIAGTIWLGDEAVKGVKAVGHGLKHAIVRIVHPHRPPTAAPGK